MNLSLKSVPKPPPRKPVCSECGSDDVRGDAFAAWDVDAQQWEVSEVYEKGGCCEACEKSNIRFKWVEA